MHKISNIAAHAKSVRRRLLSMAIVLLMVIMLFTGFVNYMTFENNYNSSLASTYSVAGNETVRKIEYALSYGKPIDNYYGMNETLKELKTAVSAMEQAYIVSPNGDMLYDLKGFTANRSLPEDVINQAFEKGKISENLGYRLHRGKAYVFIKVNDSKSHQIASLVMVFPKGSFLQWGSSFAKQLLLYLLAIAAAALAALYIILFNTKILDIQSKSYKKRILIVLISVIGISQFAYSGINYFLFKDAYSDMTYASSKFVRNAISENIESVYDKGLEIEDVYGIDEYIGSVKSGLPQVESIIIEKAQGVLHSAQGSAVHVEISWEYIDGQMLKILLDMLTMLVISVFFMIELSLMAVMIVAGNGLGFERQTLEEQTSASHGTVRALTFFISICAYMSLTFVPIVMKQMYRPMAGLSKDVALALPLSAEMLGGIFAILASGWAISEKGWRSIFYIGTVFLMGGNIMSGMGEGPLFYILARGTAGFGLGYIMMALRSLVVSLPQSGLAIAEFSAGSIAGLNCGAVIGGMLADRIGFSATFYAAAAMGTIPLLFVRRLMGAYEIENRGAGEGSFCSNIIRFAADKKAVLFVICIFVPYFISGAFLDYYFPLLASTSRLSQSDISRGFLLNGLFIIYLGPVLTKYITQSMGSMKGLMVSMLTVIAALAVFVMFGSIEAAFATIILLGIAESFGVSIKTTYFLELQGIRDLEISHSIAFFGGMVNISRMAGPVVYGAAISMGMRTGVGAICISLLLLLVIFTMFGRTNGSEQEG